MKRGFLTVSLVLLSLPVAGAQGLGSLEMLIQRGQYRLATQAVFKRLAESPDDVELHAILGVAWSKNDFYTDALGAFALCSGSIYYEDRGIEAHADALRAVGQGEAAAALRLERLLDADLNEGRELKVLIGAMDDLREAGDFDGALAIADRAEALFPRSPMAMAAVADVYLDIGDLDAADAAIWAMRQLGDTTRGAAVLARRAIIDGDLTEADAILEDSRRFRNPTARLASLRAEVLRLGGDPHSAADLLERNRWRALETPELIQVRLKVYTDMEDTSELAYWRALAESRYSANSAVRDGLTYLEDAGHSLPGEP
jgi:Flp pilus assembly protein TadD